MRYALCNSVISYCFIELFYEIKIHHKIYLLIKNIIYIYIYIHILRVCFMEHAYHKHVSVSMWASHPHACKSIHSSEGKILAI